MGNEEREIWGCKAMECFEGQGKKSVLDVREYLGAGGGIWRDSTWSECWVKEMVWAAKFQKEMRGQSWIMEGQRGKVGSNGGRRLLEYGPVFGLRKPRGSVASMMW